MKYLVIIILLVFFKVDAMNLTDYENLIKNSQSNTWELITDKVMGGKSDGKLEVLSDKRSFLRLQGNVSTENNGGFIQFRSEFEIPNDDYNGIIFNARGNPEIYYVHIRTKYTFLPWQYYSAKFMVDEDWKTLKIKFDEFKKSNFYQQKNFTSSDITTVAFVAFGKNFKAKLDIFDAKLVE